jgi:penicillin-binding protein 1A
VRFVTWSARLAITVLAGALLTTAVVVGIAPHAWSGLNAHQETAVELPPFLALAQRSYMYDLAGNEIAVLQLENSQPIGIDDVPPEVVSALLAVEDEGFYEHQGVNVRALVRALLSNFQAGSARQGASTITQQVVKNEFLAGLERDGRYKLLQARYAVLLERELSKDEILERYLNTVFFGNNAYGIQAAAETYFGKSASGLDLIEAAFLAGLVQAPSSYDPIRRPERSRRRFVQVLDRLVDVGLIDDSEAERLGEEWPLPERVNTRAATGERRTYFSEAVKDHLLNRSDVLGPTYEQRYNRLFRGGIRVYTTLDPRLQEFAESARRDELPLNTAGVDAALVSLDTASGAVRAMVGGPGFRPGVNEVNLALRRRQTGSAAKVFVLAAAMQAGAQGNDLIDGTRPCTLPNPANPSEPFAITSGVSRSVSTLREMTAASINCAYARLSLIVGLERVVALTYRMAASSYLTGDPARDGSGGRPYRIEPFASFATGANELSPFDMASGFQTIANRGVHQEPYLIDRIVGADGAEIYRHRSTGDRVLDEITADAALDVLTSPLTSGTARGSQLADGRVAAGKTGTQDNNTNAWFVGATPQLTTAVWVGDPRAYTPMVGIPEFAALGVDRVQGSTFPAAIWKRFMDDALRGEPNLPLPTAPVNPRSAARLYLPGEECLARSSSGTVPSVPPTSSDTDGEGGGGATEVTAPPVLRPIDPGTTVPADELDPRAPIPSIAPGSAVVYTCAQGVPQPTTTTSTVPADTSPPTATSIPAPDATRPDDPE